MEATSFFGYGKGARYAPLTGTFLVNVTSSITESGAAVLYLDMTYMISIR